MYVHLKLHGLFQHRTHRNDCSFLESEHCSLLWNLRTVERRLLCFPVLAPDLGNTLRECEDADGARQICSRHISDSFPPLCVLFNPLRTPSFLPLAPIYRDFIHSSRLIKSHLVHEDFSIYEFSPSPDLLLYLQSVLRFHVSLDRVWHLFCFFASLLTFFQCWYILIFKQCLSCLG